VRGRLGLLIVPALLAAAAGATASTPSRTEVVRWSPLDSAGWVKKALRVDFVPGGRCLDIGYTYVGGIAYRCSAGHGLFNACWREGPNPTEFVICTGDPWQSRVVRLRSPNLLLYPGVTHEKAATYPWAIELADGNRCTVVQGAHGAVRTHGRVFTVDYGCRRNDLVLLREGLQRGRLWQVKAARWNARANRYRFLGALPIRRVYFGSLPRSLARQHERAQEAVAAAKRLISKSARRPQFALVWVRLALPRADWARVIFRGVGSSRGWLAVLHRVDGGWTSASAHKPFCANLPKPVRSQLFLDRATWNPLPDNFQAPRGEVRC
jgi:hypothetical protein